MNILKGVSRIYLTKKTGINVSSSPDVKIFYTVVVAVVTACEIGGGIADRNKAVTA